MDKFKNYCKSYLNDESGMELLQLAIVVVIAVGLIGVLRIMQTSIAKKIQESSDKVDGWDTNTDPLKDTTK